ncbi:MAG TPA: adenylate/guanylate cyclase domain-containing protein, partial [Roseiflexaceae bacterium]|nr:adenylate/guanylate cyclase domain-containing protein [Roseiflexaceae bacterium]
MERDDTFGHWLKRRRKGLDLTQAELARRVSCAEGTIRRLEADELRPSKQLAELLAQRLEIPPADRAAFVSFARGLPDFEPPALPDQPAAVRLASAPDDPAPAGLPSGTVTFLFTDVEGSTRLWEQHPAAMRAALTRHDAILGSAIARHNGARVKGTGDGLHAAFARATDALHAALAAQRALAAEHWDAIPALRARMALHTGEAEERDGDYYGPPVNRAARLMAAAHGGQILLSRATADLVHDYLPPGVALRDLSAQRLKDLSRPEHIFQLVTPDMPADFPPLRSLASRPTNLPAQLTPLIGREQAVEQLCALLRAPEVRFVTLTGPGGSGKTRLALQVAAELLDELADGVYFVDLAPICDPSLVVSTIAQTLGVYDMGGQSIKDRLINY